MDPRFRIRSAVGLIEIAVSCVEGALRAPARGCGRGITRVGAVYLKLTVIDDLLIVFFKEL
jgi:hypothetical protein